MNSIDSIVVFEGGPKQYSYKVLRIPAIETYEFEGIEEFDVNGKRCFLGYIQARQLQLKKLPLNANPRKPSPWGKPVVKIMKQDLSQEPVLFADRNNGITIIASEVKVTGKEVEITFALPEGQEEFGDGVCNGGHTYYSIETMPGEIDSSALVKVEIIVVDQEDTDLRLAIIKDIANARNAHAELRDSTGANYTGEYDRFKHVLGEWSEKFKWYEGDIEAEIDAEKCEVVIATMAAVSPFWFKHSLNPDSPRNHHGKAITGIGGLHKEWIRDHRSDDDEIVLTKGLEMLAPMLRELLVLGDFLCRDFLTTNWAEVTGQRSVNSSTFMQEWRQDGVWKTKGLKFLRGAEELEGVAFSDIYVRSLVAMFRENIWYAINAEGVRYVGWVVDPKVLWDENKGSLVSALVDTASQFTRVNFRNSFIKDRSVHQKQLLTLNFGREVPEENMRFPWKFYDLETGKSFVRAEAGIHYPKFEYMPEMPPVLIDFANGQKGYAEGSDVLDYSGENYL